MPTRSPKTLAPLFAALLALAPAPSLDASQAVRAAAAEETHAVSAGGSDGWLELLRDRLTGWLTPLWGGEASSQPPPPDQPTAGDPTQADEGPEADPGG